ncbi:N-acetylmuramoyl-L-alanine amidase [Streptomyces sp. HMX112]|uniref:N-acetylmuramoyl-L-alanine amidase n=1 Tax=Streptomyces sp. HMX112 TaxID=3390850 RepID=UPI003A8073AC
MRPRHAWTAGATVVAGLAGALVFHGTSGSAGAHGTADGEPAPVRPTAVTAELRAGEDGRGASLVRERTERFSMLGVTWRDPGARMTGTVEVRTRAVGAADWTPWLRLNGDSGQGESGAARGGTEPAWVGPSDGVEVRVRADGATRAGLPDGLRLDMVDPDAGRVNGVAPAGPTVAEGGTGQPSEPASASPSPTGTGPTAGTAIPPAPASSAPQPPITSRADWGADESISPEAPTYLPGGKVKAVVVHHTAESNTYTCADAPRLVRGIYAYHVNQLGWKDIGYNFLVDKCGTVYEGRKGGVDRPVQGAHAYGFNSETTGVSVLGTYTDAAPPQAAMSSVAKMAAWKLGQYGVDPAGTTTLTAGDQGTNFFGKSWTKGTQLTFPTIHGHRDGYNTECPGGAFYDQLPTIRSWAADPGTEPTTSPLTGTGLPRSGR